jgi:hypothetical protein
MFIYLDAAPPDIQMQEKEMQEKIH